MNRKVGAPTRHPYARVKSFPQRSFVFIDILGSFVQFLYRTATMAQQGASRFGCSTGSLRCGHTLLTHGHRQECMCYPPVFCFHRHSRFVRSFLRNPFWWLLVTADKLSLLLTGGGLLGAGERDAATKLGREKRKQAATLQITHAESCSLSLIATSPNQRQF